MNSQQIAFEPFGTLDGVLRGEPIKIMPLGVFYRGQRKIEITPEKLNAIAANIKAGLPRFRVPINENHAGSGKIGTVYDAAFEPQGKDGPGLYATRYELTEIGKQMVRDQRFDAVSPEMIWSLNGAKYQDPQTGKEHDNVLVGLALTERPFFGHDNVALFSERPEVDMNQVPGGVMPPQNAQPNPQQQAPQQLQQKKPLTQRFRDMMAQMLKMLDDEEKGEPPHPAQQTPQQPPMPMQQMNVADLIAIDGFKDYSAEQRQEMAKSGKALPDGSYPIDNGADLQNAITAIGRAKNPGAAKALIIKRAKELGLTDKLPPDWAGSTKEENKDIQEAEHMSEQQTPPETFQVKAEEFAALQAKAAKVDDLTTKLDQFAAKLTETEKNLSSTRRERDLDRMIQHADQFTAISAKPEEIGEKLLQLQEKDPELFKYFDGLLVTLDKQLTKAELFSQFTTDRATEGADTFEGLAEQILVKDFKGDRTQYVEAMKAAETQRPDLAKAYYRQERGG